jgi:hypothetical protein
MRTPKKLEDMTAFALPQRVATHKTLGAAIFVQNL